MSAYPNLVAPVDAFPTGSLSGAVSATPQEDQAIPLQSLTGWFEVDSAGVPTTNKLGQSGPFVLQIGAEKILCSALLAGVAYVYQDATTNGRGYAGTTAAAHIAGSSVTLFETSVQSYATTNVQNTTSPIKTPLATHAGAYPMTGAESIVLATGAVTLPAPAGVAGNLYTIKDNGGGTASVLPHGAETIDGASSVALSTAYMAVTVISDGTNWWVVNQVSTTVL